jgi:preprotein translocase subunit SecE
MHPVVKTVETFLREVRVEMRKVNWPPRKETVASTWVVLAVVFVFSFYFFFVDTGIGFLIKSFFRL